MEIESDEEVEEVTQNGRRDFRTPTSFRSREGNDERPTRLDQTSPEQWPKEGIVVRDEVQGRRDGTGGTDPRHEGRGRQRRSSPRTDLFPDWLAGASTPSSRGLGRGLGFGGAGLLGEGPWLGG
ncbi:unnamed protein product [Calypogeia fissa]